MERDETEGHDAGRDQRLRLPAGTMLYPGECGFKLPDGRYLRLYEDGVWEELPDGRPSDRERAFNRPQVFANRIRTGGNPQGYGLDYRGPGYRTSYTFDVVLPARLAMLDDLALMEVAERIEAAVVEWEIAMDLDGRRILAEFSAGTREALDIDLSEARIGWTCDEDG